MFERIVILPALVLLFAGMPAWADQFSANAQSGEAQVFASLETGDGTVSYGIVTGGIGNLTGAMIFEGPVMFVNLGASSATGSDAGTVQTSANLDFLDDDPEDFFLRVVGQSGSIDAPITKTAGGGGPSGPCVEDAETLCLLEDRFSVRITFGTGAETGNGQAEELTADTGYFWFFDRDNVEMVAKILNGCSITNHFWVFAGGLTDVEVQITVTDTETGQSKQYSNPAATAFLPIQDTEAFATCP